jgi:short-subunit dehydrogenase
MKVSRTTNVMSAGEVAAAGWAAFERGARIEIPGTINKLTAYGVRGLPRRVLLPVAARAVRAMKP